jgi:ABC-type lipoprotein release transport system permease subunit
VIALWAVRAVESQLFGISVYDPWVFTAVVALLLSAALAASGIPARRAARTDPQLALRTE